MTSNAPIGEPLPSPAGQDRETTVPFGGVLEPAKHDHPSTVAEPRELPLPPEEPPLSGSEVMLRPGLSLEMQRTLGEGGMGVVYLVHDKRLGRPAALKQIRGEPTPALLARFQREIRITARLDHPAIPPVYEASLEADGLSYMLMRFVEGESLRERLSRLWRDEGRPTEQQRRELLEALVRVCEAVAYAHSRGVIHRDLKPDNVMIGAFGEVLVMDWGLARDLRESVRDDAALRESVELDPGELDSLTQVVGGWVGTLGYMAPEQLRQEEVDRRADVFSLGVMLCLMLTARSPLGDDAEEKRRNTREGRVRLPRTLDRTFPRELESVAAVALAPDRERRYPDAGALAADLRAYLGNRPVSVHRYSALERLQSLVRRWPTAIASLAVALVALLALIVLLRAQRVARDRDLDRLLERAQALLDERRFVDARELLIQASGQGAEDPRVQLGIVRAQQGIAREELGRVRERLEAATRAREAGELERARDGYLLASQVEGDPDLREAALAGLRAMEERIARERELERQRREDEARAEKARQFEAEGQRLLESGDARGAYDAFVQAIAFGSEAQAGLERARAGLAELQKEELRGRAVELVAQGDRLLAQGRLEEARRAYIQALAFAGDDEAAQAGLRQVLERQARRQQEANVRAVEADLETATAEREQARIAFLAGEPPEDVQERYMRALERLDHALFLDPVHAEARRQKALVTRELVLILRDEGRHDLAGFLERLGGDPGPQERLDVSLPVDRHLVVDEVDKQYVRQAFPGAVRFPLSRCFDKLRAWARDKGVRQRIHVRIRSQPTADNPPNVLLLRLEVRLEDLEARTVSPVTSIPIEDAPLRRPVKTTPQGVRVVAPLEQTPGLDAERLAREVERVARELIARSHR